CGNRGGKWWMDCLPATERAASGNSRLRRGYVSLAVQHRIVRGFVLIGWVELHCYRNEPPNPGNEDDPTAIDRVGVADYRNSGTAFVPRIGFCSFAVDYGPYPGYQLLSFGYFYCR